MPGRIEKTVFISYRRTNLPWALNIYQDLTHHGYDVFFDYLSINSGDFEQVILSNIKARAHFVVILTPSALERCSEPNDWLRREIETAMDEMRNIVPIFFEGFNFSTPSIASKLSGKMALLNRYNGLNVPADYFLEAMERLRTRFLNVNLDTVLHPISNDVLKVVQSQQAAANKAKQVEQRILTAQEWFEQGKKLVDEDQLEDAVQAFTKATELEGNFIEAWENKVRLLVKLERKKEASKIVKKLIHSYEEQIEIERASYEVYREQWISGAPSIYNSSIQDVLGYYDMEGLGPHSEATRFIQDREEKIKSLKTLSDELGPPE